MRRITTTLAAFALAASIAPLASNAAPCYPAPEELCSNAPAQFQSTLYNTGTDMNVLITSQGLVPLDENVKWGKRVVFQNLDSRPHRVGSPGCFDGGTSGACRFSLELPVGARGSAAKSLIIDATHGFARDNVYAYMDNVSQLGGTFYVH